MNVPVISERVRQSIRPGEKKHHLTIISEPFYRDSNIYYKVACDCGNRSVLSRSRFGKTKSCGCLVGEKEEPLLKVPADLSGVRSKSMKGGRLLVFENGEVFRVKGNFYFRARQFLSGGRKNPSGYDGGYQVVTYQGAEGQVHEYVHRLVGKAFLKQRKGANEINHKDGNKVNNHVSNLEWVTRKENTVHAYSNDLIRTLDNTPHQCIKCLEPSMRNGELCSACKAGMRQLKSTLLSRQEQRDRYRSVDTANLKPVYKRVIKSRFQCMTLNAIGKELGCTREYVRQLEEKVLDKDPTIYKSEKANSIPLVEENPEELNNFKITLKAARTNANFTSGEVAKVIGKTKATLSNWENGRSKIPTNDFKLLIKLYKVPISLLNFERSGGWIILKEAPND